MKRMRRWGLAVGTAIGLLIIYLFFNKGPSQIPPFEVSMWYWHSPFVVSDEEAGYLDKIGVERLFVRAGTFSFDGTDVVLVFPQEYEEDSARYPLTLVFPFDAGAVSHFEELDIARLSERVAERMLDQVAIAEAAGFEVEGVQLDLDCPTRLLPHYAQFVETIRNQDRRFDKSGSLKISATALVTWFGERDLNLLASQLDFIVPQVYEGQVSMVLLTARPISNPEVMARLMKNAERLPCPYYVGLPAYGRATLYDENGKFVNVYHGLPPSEALEHPSFEPISMQPVDSEGKPVSGMSGYSGENFLRLQAVQPAPDGRGRGYTLLYSIPTTVQLRRSYVAALANQSSKCLGGIVFRFPEPDESLTVSLQGQLDAISGVTSVPMVDVSLTVRSLPFEAIETQGGIAADLTIILANEGEGATAIAPNAIVLDIDIAPGSYDGTLPRHVVRIQTGIRTSEGFIETDRRQADRLRIFLSGLAAGQSTRIGPIFLSTAPPTGGKILWTVVHEDGIGSSSGETVMPETGVRE